MAENNSKEIKKIVFLEEESHINIVQKYLKN